jgi:hypothetical protein
MAALQSAAFFIFLIATNLPASGKTRLAPKRAAASFFRLLS